MTPAPEQSTIDPDKRLYVQLFSCRLRGGEPALSVLQDLATGLSVGLVYGMVGIGFVIIHRIIGVVNFAQGDLAVAGAFGACGPVGPW